MRTKSHIDEQDTGEQGFVLPYVLVVIAILAIAGTIAAQRLQKATHIIDDMQARIKSERVLISAEAAATFSLLTANPVRGGYDLSPNSPIVWEFGTLYSDGIRQMSAEQAAQTPKDIWIANGRARRFDLEARSAVITLQDLSGVLSLNAPNAPRLPRVLEATGMTRKQARDLIVNLRDYVDSDSQRRPNGAEALDYRFANMRPPSNSPLRSYGELAQVIGWAEVLPALDLTKLKDMTTIELTQSYRAPFSTPDLKAVLGIDTNSFMPSQHIDITERSEMNHVMPTNNARLTIWAARNDGRYDKRVVDLERFSGGVGQPYRRRWVYDSTVLENDLGKNNTPSGRQLNLANGINMDELEHVVHTAPVHP